jgi:hypothetical protein
LFFLFHIPQGLGAKWKIVKTFRNIEQTQHGGRTGAQETVWMFCQEATESATVCFSPVIDRRSDSVVIVRGLCGVWINMNAATFVTDEQDALSLCPAEDVANLVAVRIRCLSV